MIHVRLGDLLLRAGVVSEMQLRTALAEQQRCGGKLGSILVGMGALSEDLLLKALSKQLGVPRANLAELRVPEALLQRLDRVFCEQSGLVPIAYVQQRRSLVVAVSDPTQVVLIDELSRRVGLRVEVALAGERQVLDAIDRLYGAALDPNASVGGPGIEFVNNQGTTLIKSRDQVVAEHRTRRSAGGERSTPGLPGGGSAAELEHLAEKQARAVRAILELLLERQVLSREEYLAWRNQRPG